MEFFLVASHVVYIYTSGNLFTLLLMSKCALNNVKIMFLEN